MIRHGQTDTLVDGDSLSILSTTYSPGNGAIRLTSSSTGSINTFDWIVIRKYAEVEPTCTCNDDLVWTVEEMPITEPSFPDEDTTVPEASDYSGSIPLLIVGGIAVVALVRSGKK